jgi:hypothetical protein
VWDKYSALLTAACEGPFRKTSGRRARCPIARCCCVGAASAKNPRKRPFCSRGNWIRTSDLMLPKHAHYQAVLYPESFNVAAFARPLKPLVSALPGQAEAQTPAAVRLAKYSLKNARILLAASARWLMLFFSSGASSAMDLS